MNTIMNNANPVSLSISQYVYEYEQFSFYFQWQEESSVVLHSGHTSICSASLHEVQR